VKDVLVYLRLDAGFTMEKYNILIIINLVLRLGLLFIIPVSMFGDGIERHIPFAFGILNFEFFFPEPPVFLLLWAGVSSIFSGEILYFVLKLVPFIFFLGFVYLLPKVYSVMKLDEREKLVMTALILFATPSLLYAESILIETGILFFTALIFLLIETAEKIDLRRCFLIFIVALFMTYTKQTSYFILAGFILYVFFKKSLSRRERVLINLSIFLGLLFNVFWLIKNSLFSEGMVLSIPMLEFVVRSLNDFVQISKLGILNGLYHTYWFIPSFDQTRAVSLINLFSIPYFIYYFSFIIVTFILSIFILIGILKHYREYKGYLLIMTPLVLFLVLWGFFIGHAGDVVRYIFSFQIFIWFFAIKYVSRLKKGFFKKLFYLMVILFVGLSLVTAFATALRMDSKDSQVRAIGEVIGDRGDRILSNEGYVTVALKFYSQRIVERVVDVGPEVIDVENKIFETKNYDVYKIGELYYVHER